MKNERYQYFLRKINGRNFIISDDNPYGCSLKSLTIEFQNRNHYSSKWRHDLPYNIMFGEFGFSSKLSDYSNDLDSIRKSIENYVINGKTKIEFNYKDSPTAIMLERLKVIDETVAPNKILNIVRVSVTPDKYVKNGYQLIGLCEEKQVIGEIYESMLNVGRVGYEFEKNIDSQAWLYSPLTFYNKIKSLVIEDFLASKERLSTKESSAQISIDKVLTFSADFGSSVLWEDGCACCCGSEWPNDILSYSLYDDDDHEVHLQGLCDWMSDFEYAALNENLVFGEDFNSGSWNQEGLALATTFRKILPPNFDLWYDYPFEDYKNREKRAMLIYRR